VRFVGSRLRGRARLGLLALGFTLLLGAWVMASAPFSAPDEASHYLRATEIAQGHLLGPKHAYTAGLLSPRQRRFINYDTRIVYVSRQMRPSLTPCINGGDPPACWVETAVGNFPPLPYLLPALAIKASDDTQTGLWLGRAASALPSLLLLLLALALLWEESAVSVLGLIAAVTPMVLFSASILNSSGPGITSALAFGAAGLRLSRERAAVPTWVLVAASACGAIAVLSGPIGAVFVAAYVLLALALLGRSGILELWNGRRAGTVRALIPIVIAVVLALVWRDESGIAPGLFSIRPFFGSLHGGLRQLAPVLRDTLGTFGSQNVSLPTPVYWLGWIFELGLIATALAVGGRDDRRVMLGVTAVGLLFPVLFWAWIDRLTGFALAGREVLPILLLMPLTAGEVIRRGCSAERPVPGRAQLLGRVGRVAARRVVAGALVAIAAFQAYSWWFNAKAMAGAPHTLAFYSNAVWKPPLGWLPWIVLALLGVLSFVLFAAGELVPDPVAPERERPPVPLTA
jgi:hypothetical protein